LSPLLAILELFYLSDRFSCSIFVPFPFKCAVCTHKGSTNMSTIAEDTCCFYPLLIRTISPRALAIHIIIRPLTDIFIAIRPCHCALAISFAIHPLTDVFSAICKSISTLTIHITIRPLTDIFIAIRPSKSALAIFFVILPLTDVFSAISKSISALAIEFAILKLADIFITFIFARI